MKLTNPEKLILNMLANLNEKCGIDTDQAKLVNRAIVTGNTWALSYASEFGHINGDAAEPLPEEVRDVLDILGMWTTLENHIMALTQPERDALEADGLRLKFDGFDGNHETFAMGVAGFTVHDLGQYAWFKDTNMNSHMPRLNTYLRMLRAYNSTTGHAFALGFDDLKKILSA